MSVQLKARPSAWIVWGVVAFFFVNLAGVVGSVLVSSFGEQWFDTWLPQGATTHWYPEAWRDFTLLPVLITTLEVSALVEQLHRRARALYGDKAGELAVVRLYEDATGTLLRPAPAV